jgi:hypothetical protein
VTGCASAVTVPLSDRRAIVRGSDRHASGAKDTWRLGARRVTLAREQGEGRDPKLVARVFQKEGAR